MAKSRRSGGLAKVACVQGADRYWRRRVQLPARRQLHASTLCGLPIRPRRMALTATIYKAELQISDMDRHYYATHALTLAQHPSETEARLMARLLAFALYADDRLEFGKGLSDDSEPALLRRAYTQEIELWIELGQPDEARIRKACHRAEQVVVINFAGPVGDIWWDKTAGSLRRFDNLTVLEVPAEAIATMVDIVERSSRWQCLIQDGEMQLINEDAVVVVTPHVRMGRYLVEA